jgi:hypothetical protein
MQRESLQNSHSGSEAREPSSDFLKEFYQSIYDPLSLFSLWKAVFFIARKLKNIILSIFFDFV